MLVTAYVPTLTKHNIITPDNEVSNADYLLVIGDTC